MAAARDSFWELPPLSHDDQRIIAAYTHVGRALDQLPYSEDFRRLMHNLGETNPTDEKMFHVFQRLLSLRKKGRLPRLSQSPSEML